MEGLLCARFCSEHSTCTTYLYVLSLYIVTRLTMRFSKHLANVNSFTFYRDLMMWVL